MCEEQRMVANLIWPWASNVALVERGIGVLSSIFSGV